MPRPFKALGNICRFGPEQLRTNRTVTQRCRNCSCSSTSTITHLVSARRPALHLYGEQMMHAAETYCQSRARDWSAQTICTNVDQPEMRQSLDATAVSTTVWKHDPQRPRIGSCAVCDRHSCSRHSLWVQYGANPLPVGDDCRRSHK